MMPQILSPDLSVDRRFELHMWMAHHDPDHLQNTRVALGHEPSEEELVRHWLNAGVAGFENTLSQIARVNTQQQNC